MMVELAYYAIMRRHQQERLQYIDREERPAPLLLMDFEYKGPQDIDYYNPTDYFIGLGEWLRTYAENERRRNYVAKQRQQTD